MADSPPPPPIPPPSPPPPCQRAISEAFKNEPHAGSELDPPFNADQQLRASGKLNIDELLNRISTLKQVPGDMQRSPLQPPPQNSFPNAAGQVPGAGLTPPQQGYGTHQPGMAFGFPQMAMPWNSGQNPNPCVGFPGDLGQHLPWAHARPILPYHQLNMPQTSLQQVSDFNSGYVSQRGFSSQQAIAIRTRGRQMHGSMPSTRGQSLERGQSSVRGQPALRGQPLQIRSRGGIQNQASMARYPQPDPNDPCCQCGSTVHQLKHHPNPNTPQGYLRGCLHCNKLDHSFASCAFRAKLKGKNWYYLRECRTGLCPAEDFRDFREIHKHVHNAEYSVEMHLPLTPEFALRNLYPEETAFRHPLEGGHIVLLEDPFWDSGDPLAGLGDFGVHEAEADQNDRDMWGRRAGQRRYEIRQQIEARSQASVLGEAQAPHMESRSVQPDRKSKLMVKAESSESQEDIDIGSYDQLPRSMQSSAATPRQSVPNQHPLSNDHVVGEVSNRPSSRQYMTSGQLISHYLARQHTSTDRGHQFKSWLQPPPSRSRQYSTAAPSPQPPRSSEREEKRGTKRARQRNASPPPSEHSAGNASGRATYDRGERRNKRARTRPVLNLAHYHAADSYSD